MKTDVKLEAFMDWLVETEVCTPESAISYDSYVRNAAKLLGSDVSTLTNARNVDLLIEGLNDPSDINSVDQSDKTLKNYEAGLKAYRDFLLR